MIVDGLLMLLTQQEKEKVLLLTGKGHSTDTCLRKQEEYGLQLGKGVLIKTKAQTLPMQGGCTNDLSRPGEGFVDERLGKEPINLTMKRGLKMLVAWKMRV